MKIIIPTLLTLLLLPLAAQAENKLLQQRLAVIAQADRCDLLGAEEINALTTKPFQEIFANLAQTRQLLREKMQQRYDCYAAALKAMDEYLLLAGQDLKGQPFNVPQVQQYWLDQGLRTMLAIRQKISEELVFAILGDLEKTPAESAFMHESAKTKELLQQDLLTLLEHTRRQLQLDEQNIWLGEPTADQVAAIKLALASNAISVAQTLYEQLDHSALLMSRLDTALAALPAHIQEIQTFAASNPGLTAAVALALPELKLAADAIVAVTKAQPQLTESALQTFYDQLSSLQVRLTELQGQLNP